MENNNAIIMMSILIPLSLIILFSFHMIIIDLLCDTDTYSKIDLHIKKNYPENTLIKVPCYKAAVNVVTPSGLM